MAGSPKKRAKRTARVARRTGMGQDPFAQPGPPGTATPPERAPAPADPDAEQVLRNQARIMSGYGLERRDIATAMGLRLPDLERRFLGELEQGDAQAKVNLARSGYEMAVGRVAQFDASGNRVRDEVKTDRSVLIFLMKARLGFTDQPAHDDPLSRIDWAKLSPQEFETLVRLLTKAERQPDPVAANDVSEERDAVQGEVGDGGGAPGARSVH